MKAIIFKKSNSFKASIHEQLAKQKLANEHLDLANLKASFKLREYVVATNFCFHLGWGAAEPTHIDLPTYQALLVVNPNGWVVKGSNDSHKFVYQDKGDLIILNTGIKHEVVWDRHFPKPTEPWLYLFVDAYDRRKWSKKSINKHQAEQLAIEAICELENQLN